MFPLLNDSLKQQIQWAYIPELYQEGGQKCTQGSTFYAAKMSPDILTRSRYLL